MTIPTLMMSLTLNENTRRTIHEYINSLTFCTKWAKKRQICTQVMFKFSCNKFKTPLRIWLLFITYAPYFTDTVVNVYSYYFSDHFCYQSDNTTQIYYITDFTCSHDTINCSTNKLLLHFIYFSYNFLKICIN